ncbi:MAG TPA: YoaK family protein [Xanthobacteraceae bacterium]|nr:YoaK family protein [Xanthobacteraceae bacterium]
MASFVSTATTIASQHADRIVLALLGFAAGYVDGCTTVALFGLFVAQVTGSFVVAGALLVVREQGALIKVLAIPAFVVGAAVATVLVSWVRGAATAVLGLECLLLIGLAATALGGPMSGPDEPRALAAGLFGLGAMGVQSAFVRLTMRRACSTNVMTTNTTQVAIDVTVALLDRLARAGLPRLQPAHDPGEARDRLAQTVPVMLAFLAGTLGGAVASHRIGFVAMMLPIAIMLGLTVRAARRGR